MALMSFKQEIVAVRELLQSVAFDRTRDEVPAALADRLARTVHELETAEEEIARQTGRFEGLADELRQARTHYRVLLDSMPVPCVITDIHGTVRTMNPAAALVMGSPASVIGKPLLARVPHSERAAVRDRMGDAGKGMASAWEGLLVHGEDAVDVGFTVGGLGEPGDEIVELLWTLSDLREQRRMEEQQRLLSARVQHLSSSNQELEEFAHVVAHDLKEPLRGMRLTAGFVEEDTKGRIDGASAFRIKTIQTLCGRGMAMVDSVLEAAKIAGAPMRLEAVLVSDLVAEATQRLIASITEHRARVSCDDAACTIKVRCDRAQAARALANLIANGIKYNDSPEKRVVVSIAPAHDNPLTREDEASRFVQLCVTDNGVGVPPDQTSAIFRMFSRLAPQAGDLSAPASEPGSATATVVDPAAPRRDGTGAGLAIVKKIVEKHGGRVWVEPGQRGGTTFCLTLPRA